MESLASSEIQHETNLQSHGVKSVDDPHAVRHVALQGGSAHHHVPHARRVWGADVSLSREWRHCQGVTAGYRQDRLHASETSVQIILQDQITYVMILTKQCAQSECEGSIKYSPLLWRMEAEYHSTQAQSSYKAEPEDKIQQFKIKILVFISKLLGLLKNVKVWTCSANSPVLHPLWTGIQSLQCACHHSSES